MLGTSNRFGSMKYSFKIPDCSLVAMWLYEAARKVIRRSTTRLAGNCNRQFHSDRLLCVMSGLPKYD